LATDTDFRIVDGTQRGNHHGRPLYHDIVRRPEAFDERGDGGGHYHICIFAMANARF
jgi:hypothetical protein